MGASTAYGILTHVDNRNRTDIELMTRFYKPRDTSLIPVHKLNFPVVRASMQARFLLEMIVFFFNVCAFNLYLATFVRHWNDLINALHIAEISYRSDVESGIINVD